jgi:hypothetical protein
VTSVAERPSQLIVRSLLQSATAVGALLLAYALVPLRGRWWWVGASIGVVALVAIVPLAVRRLRRVMVSEHPVLAAADAVIVLAAVLVTAFAGIYYSVADISGQFNGLETRIDSMYFTVTTLSTVGFGDVSASGQASRVIVTLQILVNLAFFGVVVRVFSTVVQHRSNDRMTNALARRPNDGDPGHPPS